jgi:hypothetical protein
VRKQLLERVKKSFEFNITWPKTALERAQNQFEVKVTLKKKLLRDSSASV